MSRIPIRFLATATAAAVVAALAPGVPGAAAAEPPAPKPTTTAPEGISLGETTVASETFTALPADPLARARWPIGGGGADLTVHPEAPTGDASQRFTRVRMAHYRAYGGVTEAVVDLAAAPTAATRSVVRLAFGRVSGTNCVSAAGQNYNFSSTDVDTQNNPVYSGRRITVRPFEFPSARKATWNCAFAQTLNLADTTMKYDAVAGASGLFRQKPLLSIRVKGRKLKRTGFTRVPIVIRNGRGTVATAPNVRLSWKTRGVQVRATRKVGKIRPGTAKRSFFLVRDTRRGNGRIIFTVRSRDVRVRLSLPVREPRR